MSDNPFIEELTEGYLDIKHPEILVRAMSDKVFKQWLRTDEYGEDTGEYEEKTLQALYAYFDKFDLEYYQDLILNIFQDEFSDEYPLKPETA